MKKLETKLVVFVLAGMQPWRCNETVALFGGQAACHKFPQTSVKPSSCRWSPKENMRLNFLASLYTFEWNHRFFLAFYSSVDACKHSFLWLNAGHKVSWFWYRSFGESSLFEVKSCSSLSISSVTLSDNIFFSFLCLFVFCWNSSTTDYRKRVFR